MARVQRISKGKTMKPNYFVFCEGDTEVAYVEMLRAYYRLPIHIIPKRTLLNVTPALISRCKANYIETKNDKTFLMYDLDVPSLLDRLRKIPGAILLCSNPCVELWLLQHYTEQRAEISSADCVNKLSRYIKQYKKGKLSVENQMYLMNNVLVACKRAKQLKPHKNPSSTVYELIGELEKLKGQRIKNMDKCITF